MKLVDNGEVLNRLAGIQGIQVPRSLQEAGRLDGYIEGASGQALLKSGYSAPPKEGTEARGSLNDIAARLAVNAILADLMGLDPAAREALRRERNDILAEAEGLAGDSSPGGGFFFEVAGST